MEQDFLDLMSKEGIPPSHTLVFDGKLRRYRVNGDKKGRKNAWYRYVQVTNEYAWGVFGCNKRNISAKWSSKDSNAITTYEKKERRKQEIKIRDDEEELQTRAAIKANNLWGWLREADGNHPYLIAKSVAAHGLRQLNSALVMPLYVENYIVSLQYIYPDGMKRYLTGGQKKGAYFWIGDETDIIYICEGYSTGASVHEATGKQVVICFDSGNLPTVARMLRDKMPDKKIIIAGDNDQWEKGNPGYSKAQEAARDMGAEIKIPPFNYEDKSRPTDWNDYHRRYGIRALCEELLGINKVINTPSVADKDKWRLELIEGKQQLAGYRDFDGKSRYNAFLFLENHEKFREILVYNEFSDQIMLVRCPPWEPESKFMPRILEETDAFAAAKELEKLSIKVRNEDVYNCLRMIAKKSPINPPRDYFENLQWDGVPRLDNWLAYYLGAESQPLEYLKAVGSKWMIAGVKRVYEPGCKFDNVLVLEGEQGTRKTSAFQTIATFHNEPYFLEFSGSVGVRDSLMLMQGKLIVEMSELSSMRKSDVEEMRGFISRRVDEYRPPYARSPIKRKRFFILGATTNNKKEDGYFVDPTGNRRYWPTKCGSIDLEALERDKEQLWAEAVCRYKENETVWLEDEEKELAFLEQAGREAEDIWLEPISDFLIGRLETSVNQIAAGIGLTTEQKNSKNDKRLVKCLRDLGWEPGTRRSTENGKITMWRRKNVP